MREPGDPGLSALGHAQAASTAAWLRVHLSAVPVAIWSSPLRRAVETAAPIAAALAIEAGRDDRFRERMNWDGSIPFDTFLQDWSATTVDRDHRPRLGDSSNEAAARFLRGLADAVASAQPGSTVVVVAHGGVTTDALRTILGDEALAAIAPTLLSDGVPSAAITTLSWTTGWTVDAPPSTAHLGNPS